VVRGLRMGECITNDLGVYEYGSAFQHYVYKSPCISGQTCTTAFWPFPCEQECGCITPSYTNAVIATTNYLFEVYRTSLGWVPQVVDVQPGVCGDNNDPCDVTNNAWWANPPNPYTEATLCGQPFVHLIDRTNDLIKSGVGAAWAGTCDVYGQSTEPCGRSGCA